MKMRTQRKLNIIASTMSILLLIVIIILNIFDWGQSVRGWTIGILIFELLVLLFLVFSNNLNQIIEITVSAYNKVLLFLQKSLSKIFEKWAIQLKAKLKKVNYEYDNLAPIFIENCKNAEILKLQIDNPQIKNIAISGPYGSGKSSLLHTFKISYPQYKCLNLSLAAFSEEYPNRIKKSSIKSVSIDQLEYSLVQQFFYHVKAKDIPDSRFGRIRRWNWLNKTIVTTSVLLFILCSLYLIKPNWLETIFTDADFLINSYIQYTCFAISGIILFYATYKFVSYIHKFNGGRVKLMNYEIELQKDIKTSIFNRYLDELVYLFQTTKYEIVILEDLDRFENTNIFARLRELNTLLNQSQDIGRRIVFIYALRDGVFRESKERTKFFDFILPIVPHTNVSNSATQFVKILSSIVEKNLIKDISKDFLYDVSPFVSDLRTIKAIVSEFMMYSSYINLKLSKRNLLAMIIYKNLYPKDFEQIYEGKGIIVELFEKKTKIINNRISIIDKKIEEINSKLEMINSEPLNTVEELNLIIIVALIKQVPESSILYDSNKNRINYCELFKDENLTNILNQKYQYYYDDKYNKINILKILGDEFDYEKRKNKIEYKNSSESNELYSRKYKLEQERKEISQISMQELCKREDIMKYITGDEENIKLLKFLISRGYIDEDYFFYITIFEEGILTLNDIDYLLSIKCNDDFIGNDIIHKLDNPNIILQYLVPQDFMSNKILNINLINEILEQKEETYKTNLIKKIKEGDRHIIEFLRKYITIESINGELIQLIVRHYNNLWRDIEDNSSISESEKIFIFNMLLMYADSFYIYVNNYGDKRFKFFIEENPYFQYIQLPDTANKFKEVIKYLNANIKEVSTDTSYNEFTDFLYQGNFYALNKNNVTLMLQRYSDIDLSLYNSSIYSAVIDANIEPLASYINANIENFVKECILSAGNIEEYESTIILLLNNEDISKDLRNSLIEHNETIIENVEAINDNDLRNKLYTLNRVKPTLLNITCYLGYNDLDEIDSTLLKFINSNSDSIINCIKNSEENDFAIEALLKKDGVIDDVWQEIFINRFYRKIIKENLFSLRSEQFLFYIDTEKKADLILGNLDVTSISLMKKVLKLSKNTILKMKGVTRYLENNPDIEISCINDLLIAMGEDFAILTTNKGETFEIEKSVVAENFIEELLKRDIVSNFKEHKNKYSVYIKKVIK